MKIIQEREIVTTTIYSHTFDYEGYVGWGCMFDCSKEGRVNLFKMADPAQQNYLSCLLGFQAGKKVIDKGIISWQETYKREAKGLCDCGEEVYLGGFTNTCDKCGKDYNWAGQELAPRECWGEETGESYSDIMTPLGEDW
jgi:hypothetical protein